MTFLLAVGGHAGQWFWIRVGATLVLWLLGMKVRAGGRDER
jgi:hypothetical protein